MIIIFVSALAAIYAKKKKQHWESENRAVECQACTKTTSCRQEYGVPL